MVPSLDADERSAQSMQRYVPRALSEWDLDPHARRWRQLTGTLCFVDISGFTKLSEKLSRRGRIGAEELTAVLDRVFGDMLRLSYERGGSLLKFGGDALLLLFVGDDHAVQGACAAVEMRSALRAAARETTSTGRIDVRMSVGLHSGAVDLFRVGTSHHELVVTGHAATMTAQMEHAAAADQILVSAATRDLLPPGAAPSTVGPGHLLSWRRAKAAPAGTTSRKRVSAASIESCVPVGLRAHLADASSEPEHRIASIGFVRFGGIESRLRDHGADEVGDDLDAFVSAIQHAVDEEGVTFLGTDLDTDGGKVILTAGVPRTQDDDAGRMLRAVRDIADADVPFSRQIGVHRDHVFATYIGTEFRNTYTVMGDTVNLAARLMAAAPVGEIYASPSALADARSLFAVTQLEPFTVKGKDAPVHAFAVGAATGTRERPTSDLPFVGRSVELGLMRSERADDTPGRVAVVSVVGEAGMGKTRLAQEVLADTPADQILLVRAEPNGADIPYWSFRDPLRRLLGIARTSQDEMATRLEAALLEIDPGLLPVAPLIGDAVDIDLAETPLTGSIQRRFRPARTAAAVVELLGRVHTGRFTLWVEDAHWLDEASAGLLDRLVAASSTRPWFVIVTSRPEGGDHHRPLGRVVNLGPLSDDDARILAIAATPATPLRSEELGAIVTRAAGNPLFLEEILLLVRTTGSAEAIPHSIDAVVGEKLDALRPITRQVLRYVSVLGLGFRLAVAQAILTEHGIEVDEATLQELGAFIERDGDHRLRFRHPVAQHLAYSGLSYRRRRELHLSAGRTIERLAGPDTDPVSGFLAMHFSRAGVHDLAWRYGLVAGERAVETYANVEAAGHFERALASSRHLAEVTPAAKGEVLAALGDVRELAGLFELALEAFREASRLTSDPVARADLMLKRARTRMHLGAYRVALGEATRGLRSLESLDGIEIRRARARLQAIRALLRQAQQRAAEALTLAEEAIHEAEAGGEDEALARAYLIADWAHHMMGMPERAVHGEAALEIYERLGDLDGAGNVLNNLGGIAYFDGDWALALDRYTTARDTYLRAGNNVSAAVSASNLGELLISQRRHGEAEPVLTEAVRVLRAAHALDDVLFAEIQLGRLLVERGDTSEAIERLTELRTSAADLGQTGYAFEAAIHLASALVGADKAHDAIELLESAELEVGEVDSLYVPSFTRVRASAEARLGRPQASQSLIDSGLEVARDQGLSYEEALLVQARIGLDRERGREPAAADVTLVDTFFRRRGVVPPGADGATT